MQLTLEEAPFDMKHSVSEGLWPPRGSGGRDHRDRKHHNCNVDNCRKSYHYKIGHLRPITYSMSNKSSLVEDCPLLSLSQRGIASIVPPSSKNGLKLDSSEPNGEQATTNPIMVTSTTKIITNEFERQHELEQNFKIDHRTHKYAISPLRPQRPSRRRLRASVSSRDMVAHGTWPMRLQYFSIILLVNLLLMVAIRQHYQLVDCLDSPVKIQRNKQQQQQQQQIASDLSQRQQQANLTRIDRVRRTNSEQGFGVNFRPSTNQQQASQLSGTGGANARNDECPPTRLIRSLLPAEYVGSPATSQRPAMARAHCDCTADPFGWHLTCFAGSSSGLSDSVNGAGLAPMPNQLHPAFRAPQLARQQQQQQHQLSGQQTRRILHRRSPVARDANEHDDDENDGFSSHEGFGEDPSSLSSSSSSSTATLKRPGLVARQQPWRATNASASDGWQHTSRLQTNADNFISSASSSSIRSAAPVNNEATGGAGRSRVSGATNERNDNDADEDETTVEEDNGGGRPIMASAASNHLTFQTIPVLFSIKYIRNNMIEIDCDQAAPLYKAAMFQGFNVNEISAFTFNNCQLPNIPFSVLLHRTRASASAADQQVAPGGSSLASHQFLNRAAAPRSLTAPKVSLTNRERHTNLLRRRRRESQPADPDLLSPNGGELQAIAAAVSNHSSQRQQQQQQSVGVSRGDPRVRSLTVNLNAVVEQRTLISLLTGLDLLEELQLNYMQLNLTGLLNQVLASTSSDSILQTETARTGGAGTTAITNGARTTSSAEELAVAATVSEQSSRQTPASTTTTISTTPPAAQSKQQLVPATSPTPKPTQTPTTATPTTSTSTTTTPSSTTTTTTATPPPLTTNTVSLALRPLRKQQQQQPPPTTTTGGTNSMGPAIVPLPTTTAPTSQQATRPTASGGAVSSWPSIAMGAPRGLFVAQATGLPPTQAPTTTITATSATNNSPTTTGGTGPTVPSVSLTTVVSAMQQQQQQLTSRRQPSIGVATTQLQSTGGPGQRQQASVGNSDISIGTSQTQSVTYTSQPSAGPLQTRPSQHAGFFHQANPPTLRSSINISGGGGVQTNWVQTNTPPSATMAPSTSTSSHLATPAAGSRLSSSVEQSHHQHRAQNNQNFHSANVDVMLQAASGHPSEPATATPPSSFTISPISPSASSGGAQPTVPINTPAGNFGARNGATQGPPQTRPTTLTQQFQTTRTRQQQPPSITTTTSTSSSSSSFTSTATGTTATNDQNRLQPTIAAGSRLAQTTSTIAANSNRHPALQTRRQQQQSSTSSSSSVSRHIGGHQQTAAARSLDDEGHLLMATPTSSDLLESSAAAATEMSGALEGPPDEERSVSPGDSGLSGGGGGGTVGLPTVRQKRSIGAEEFELSFGELLPNLRSLKLESFLDLSAQKKRTPTAAAAAATSGGGGNSHQQATFTAAGHRRLASGGGEPLVPRTVSTNQQHPRFKRQQSEANDELELSEEPAGELSEAASRSRNELHVNHEDKETLLAEEATNLLLISGRGNQAAAHPQVAAGGRSASRNHEDHLLSAGSEEAPSGVPLSSSSSSLSSSTLPAATESQDSTVAAAVAAASSPESSLDTSGQARVVRQMSMVLNKLFSKLNKLRVLQLVSNELPLWPDGVLQDSRQSLMRLYLISNNIRQLGRQSFANLTELQTLDLSSNQLRSLSGDLLRDLVQLRHLRACRNLFRKLPLKLLSGSSSKQPGSAGPPSSSSVVKFARLESVDFSKNKYLSQLTTIYEQSSAPQMTSLAHQQQQQQQQQLAPLVNLNLSDCSLTDQLVVAASAAQQQQASSSTTAAQAPTTTGRGAVEQFFASLAELVNVSLQSNKLRLLLGQPNLFAKNARLQRLDLSHNQLQVLSSHLFNVNASQLSELQLNHNQISEVPEQFLFNCRKLRRLSLAHNRLSQLSAKMFLTNQLLEHLDLSHNQLVTLNTHASGSIPFGNGANLRQLLLAHNNLTNFQTDLVEIAWSFYTNLQVLDLSHNKFRGQISMPIFYTIADEMALSLASNSIQSISVEALVQHEQVLERYATFEAEDATVAGQHHRRTNTAGATSSTGGQTEAAAAAQVARVPTVIIKLSNNPMACDCLLEPLISYSRRVAAATNPALLASLFQATTSTSGRHDSPAASNLTPGGGPTHRYSYLAANELSSASAGVGGQHTQGSGGGASRQPQVMYQFKFNDLHCAKPSHLSRRLLSHISIGDLLCPIRDERLCPRECDCNYQSAFKTAIVDCNNRRLQQVPEQLTNAANFMQFDVESSLDQQQQQQGSGAVGTQTVASVDKVIIRLDNNRLTSINQLSKLFNVLQQQQPPPHSPSTNESAIAAAEALSAAQQDTNQQQGNSNGGGGRYARAPQATATTANHFKAAPARFADHSRDSPGHWEDAGETDDTYAELTSERQAPHDSQASPPGDSPRKHNSVVSPAMIARTMHQSTGGQSGGGAASASTTTPPAASRLKRNSQLALEHAEESAAVATAASDEESLRHPTNEVLDVSHQEQPAASDEGAGAERPAPLSTAVLESAEEFRNKRYAQLTCELYLDHNNINSLPDSFLAPLDEVRASSMVTSATPPQAALPSAMLEPPVHTKLTSHNHLLLGVGDLEPMRASGSIVTPTGPVAATGASGGGGGGGDGVDAPQQVPASGGGESPIFGRHTLAPSAAAHQRAAALTDSLAATSGHLDTNWQQQAEQHQDYRVSVSPTLVVLSLRHNNLSNIGARMLQRLSKLMKASNTKLYLGHNPFNCSENFLTPTSASSQVAPTPNSRDPSTVDQALSSPLGDHHLLPSSDSNSGAYLESSPDLLASDLSPAAASTAPDHRRTSAQAATSGDGEGPLPPGTSDNQLPLMPSDCPIGQLKTWLTRHHANLGDLDEMYCVHMPTELAKKLRLLSGTTNGSAPPPLDQSTSSSGGTSGGDKLHRKLTMRSISSGNNASSTATGAGASKLWDHDHPWASSSAAAAAALWGGSNSAPDGGGGGAVNSSSVLLHKNGFTWNSEQLLMGAKLIDIDLYDMCPNSGNQLLLDASQSLAAGLLSPRSQQILISVALVFILISLALLMMLVYFGDTQTILAFVYIHMNPLYRCLNLHEGHLDGEKLYDAFVSYSSADRDIVMELIERLERMANPSEYMEPDGQQLMPTKGSSMDRSRDTLVTEADLRPDFGPPIGSHQQRLAANSFQDLSTMSRSTSRSMLAPDATSNNNTTTAPSMATGGGSVLDLSGATPKKNYSSDYLQDDNNNHLMPRPYKLCIHERDWLPGHLISWNIVNSVQNSRRTILILSKEFIKSVWFQVEFHTAYYQMLEDKMDRLIVIVRGELPPREELDKNLAFLLTTKTYLTWGEKWFWERLHYALPHRSQPPLIVGRRSSTGGFSNRAYKKSATDQQSEAQMVSNGGRPRQTSTPLRQQAAQAKTTGGGGGGGLFHSGAASNEQRQKPLLMSNIGKDLLLPVGGGAAAANRQSQAPASSTSSASSSSSPTETSSAASQARSNSASSFASGASSTNQLFGNNHQTIITTNNDLLSSPPLAGATTTTRLSVNGSATAGSHQFAAPIRSSPAQSQLNTDSGRLTATTTTTMSSSSIRNGNGGGAITSILLEGNNAMGGNQNNSRARAKKQEKLQNFVDKEISQRLNLSEL